MAVGAGKWRRLRAFGVRNLVHLVHLTPMLFVTISAASEFRLVVELGRGSLIVIKFFL